MGFVSLAVFRIAFHDTKGDIPAPGLILMTCFANLFTLGIAEILSIFIFWLRFDRIADARDLQRYKDEFFAVTLRRERILRWIIASSIIGNAIFLLAIW